MKGHVNVTVLETLHYSVFVGFVVASKVLTIFSIQKNKDTIENWCWIDKRDEKHYDSENIFLFSHLNLFFVCVQKCLSFASMLEIAGYTSST